MSFALLYHICCALFESKSSLEFKSVGYANILPMNLKVPWVAYAWSKSKLLWVQIWKIRLCKFVLAMLEVWSCFQKKFKKGKFPSDIQCPTRAICHIPWKAFTHMLLDVLLSFVKLCDPSEMLFMLSRSQARTRPILLLHSYTGISTTIHPFDINKCSMSWWSLS